jgi:hypothetical protein
MDNLTKFIIGITMLLVTHVAYSDTKVADIKNLLSQEKFDQMGLSKLSDRELSELYQWIKSGEFEESLAEKPPIDTVQVALNQSAPKVVDLERNQTIKATIKGKFSGWSGKTIFKLSNGQVWRQRIKGNWRYRAESPSVEIKKNFMGYYVMRVDDKKSVGVSQIK